MAAYCIAVVNTSTLTIDYKYIAPAPQQAQFGGPWGNPEEYQHVAAPAFLKDIIRAIKKADGNIGLVSDPTLVAHSSQNQMIALRGQRDNLLKATDWTQVEDAPLSEDLKQKYKEYRQALRDLPDMTSDPMNPDWPMDPLVYANAVAAAPAAVAPKTPEAAPDSALETAPEAAPETTQEATPEAAPEVAPEAAPEATPEATPEAAPEATPEAAPSVAPETTPEVVAPTPEATPEAAPEAAPSVAPETTPEVVAPTPEATPEAAPAES